MKTKTQETKLLIIKKQILILNALFFFIIIYIENHFITSINKRLVISAAKISLNSSIKSKTMETICLLTTKNKNNQNNNYDFKNSKVNKDENNFKDYEGFSEGLKTSANDKYIKKLPVNDSFSNLVFQKEIKNPYKSLYSDSINFNSTLDDILKNYAREEIFTYSKVIALNELIGMFEFSQTKPLVSISRFIFNLKEYKILEKIGEEKWIEFLENKKIKLSDIRRLIDYYNDDPEFRVNINNIVEKHKKLSILYTLKINDKQTEALKKFKTEKWIKIPGGSLGFDAYLKSILIIFQKIRLVGKGSKFESLAVSNDEGIKSLMSMNHKKLTKIDISNFFAREVKKGENKFYFAYKSNFEIFRSDENEIINYALELPYLKNLYKFQEKIDLVFPKEIISKRIFKFNLHVNLPTSLLKEEMLRQNYLFIYKLSSNYLEKNSFLMLNIKNMNTTKIIANTLSSNFVHLPFYSDIKNIFGLTAVKLPKGIFQVSADLKFILPELNLDNKLDINNKNNKNINTKTVFNAFNVNKNIKKQFEEENNLKKIDENYEINSKNKSIIKPEIKIKEPDKLISIKLPEKNETQKLLLNATENENGKKHKKKHNKKHKKKQKKHMNKTDLNLRDGEDESEGEENEENSEDINAKFNTNRPESQFKNNLNNRSFSNKTDILFAKNKVDEFNINKTKTNYEKHFENLQIRKFKSDFLLEKIEELSLKLEKTDIGESEIINFSIADRVSNDTQFDPKAKNLFELLNFIQTDQNKIKQVNNEETNLEEENEDEEENDEDEDEDEENRFLGEHEANNTKLKKKKKHKKKHKKKKNSTIVLNTVIMKDLNKTINSSSLLNQNKAGIVNVIDQSQIEKNLFKINNQNTEGKDYNFSIDQKSDDKTTKKIMNNLNQALKSVNNETVESSIKIKNDFFELNVIRLPLSTLIYNKIYKNIFNFRSNNELNIISSLALNFKLHREKNVMIFLNVILSLDYIADFEFRLFLNGEEECNSSMTSKSKRIINENSINIKKMPVGDYKLEVLYNSNKQGSANLGNNEWDVFSLVVVVFEI